MSLELIQQILGITASTVAILATYPYVISIVRGETIPHRRLMEFY